MAFGNGTYTDPSKTNVKFNFQRDPDYLRSLGGGPTGGAAYQRYWESQNTTPTRTTTTSTGSGGGGGTGSGGGTGGGGSANVGPIPPRVAPPSTVGRESDIGISPSATSLGQLDAAGAAAQRAVFGRAKDRAGQVASSALSGLRSALASRGMLGSGIETQGTVDAAMQGAGLIADTSREEAIQEAQRGERAREFQTQAQLQQRGQNVTQRGQDLGQILGARGQDITQRGQDFTGRGQDITLAGLRQAANGMTTTTTTQESEPPALTYSDYAIKPLRRY